MERERDESTSIPAHKVQAHCDPQVQEIFDESPYL